MNNDLIKFDFIETYPQKLLDYLKELDHQEEFPNIDKNMVKYIESFNAYIYHCTKLKNKNGILKRGVKRIAFSQQLKNDYISILKEISDNSYNYEGYNSYLAETM